MKKIVRLLLVVYIIAAGFFFAGEDLSGVAARQVSKECVEAIPHNVHTRLVAVGDIKGDDGKLARTIVNSLKGDAYFQVMERKELDALLKEQSLQLSDLVSPDARVRPGMIRGVEGLIGGQVLEERDYQVYAAYRVNLKMMNVQTGEILLSKEISASATSPRLLPCLVGLAVLLVLNAMVGVLSSVREKRNERGRGREESFRKKILATLKASMDTLRYVEQGLEMDSDAGSINELRTTRSSLELVYDKAAAVRFSDPDNESPKSLIKHDARVLKETTALLENVQRMKNNGDAASFDKALKRANAYINDIELMLTTRQ